MKNDKVYIIHIVECIQWIESYTKKGSEDFFNNKLIQDAVIRNLEVIGEAAKKISVETKEQNTNIPWRKMTGLRDIIAHDYFGVDLSTVWNVVKNELPNLKKDMQNLICKIE